MTGAPSPTVEEAAEELEDRKAHSPFPIVGLGASAGGLEALTRLLKALPRNTGAAFVIVQHLSPTRESELATILARATSMPVTEVVDQDEVKPNHVYVLPPGKSMVLVRGHLRLLTREGRGVQHPIDQFFGSLAETQLHMAIGVVLSGTATDGTLGLEAIKAEGGITFAQDDSAQQGGMPQSAIGSGCVDFELPPEAIAKELVRIAADPQLALHAQPQVAEEDDAAEGKSALLPILRQVRQATHIDFSGYKLGTLSRRIRRRMLLAKQKDLKGYERYVRANAGEAQALYQDILINVTGFFRDTEVFEALKARIVPRLLDERARGEPLRIWVLGCATGEEAYSLAMIVSEVADGREGVPAQIFATDLSAEGVTQARAGLYAEARLQDVSAERLRRFFVKQNGKFQVTKALREMCVFSRHNVMADPPFSRMDLISCRNLLIYVEPDMQQRILRLLHYALRPQGALVLGASETVGTLRDLFATDDKKRRIFSKTARSGVQHDLPAFPLQTTRREDSPPVERYAPAAGPGAGAARVGAFGATDVQGEAARILAGFAPPAVLVDANLEILQFHGATEPYLVPAEGKASLALLKMARCELLVPLRALLHRAKKENVAVTSEDLRVESKAGIRQVNLQVLPVGGRSGESATYLVLFQEASPAPASGTKSKGAPKSQPAGTAGDYETHIARLERELATGREHVQALMEQHDAASEELQSANEEGQSANEELQSINEELATSKEEIQSSNEELTTVNDELHSRNVELGQLNGDLTNLIHSLHVAIVIVGRDFRIRRASPMAEKLLNIIPSDVGRPVSDIRMKLGALDLREMLAETIDSISPAEREVQLDTGRWYALRVRPYITIDNKVDGAVFSLVDIHATKLAREYAESVIATVGVPLLVLDEELRVRTASRAYCSAFRVEPEQTEGRFVHEIGHGVWDVPELRRQLAAILPTRSQVQAFEVEREVEGLGRRIMVLDARAIVEPGGQSQSILLAIRDVTDERNAGLVKATLAAIVAASEDAVISTDLKGIVTSWNQAAEHLFGYSEAEMMGRALSLLIPPYRPDEEPQSLESIRRGARVEAYDTVRKRKDGSLLDVSVSVSPLRDADGRVIGASKIARDVTGRKRTEEELRESYTRLRSHAEELSRFNHVAVGRELRMIELKKEINDLCGRNGEAPRYPLDFEPQGTHAEGGTKSAQRKADSGGAGSSP